MAWRNNVNILINAIETVRIYEIVIIYTTKFVVIITHRNRTGRLFVRHNVLKDKYEWGECRVIIEE